MFNYSIVALFPLVVFVPLSVFYFSEIISTFEELAYSEGDRNELTRKYYDQRVVTWHNLFFLPSGLAYVCGYLPTKLSTYQSYGMSVATAFWHLMFATNIKDGKNKPNKMVVNLVQVFAVLVAGAILEMMLFCLFFLSYSSFYVAIEHLTLTVLWWWSAVACGAGMNLSIYLVYNEAAKSIMTL